MNGLEVAIYNKLIGSAELTGELATPKSVYAYSAPENAPLPIVVFFMQSGATLYTLESRIATNWLYAIKAITQGNSIVEASNLDGLIDDLFTDQPLPVNGDNAMMVRRESAIPSYTEFQAGVRYNHVGGSYRIWTGD